MKSSIVNMVLILCDMIGINFLFKQLNSRKIRILMYHGVDNIVHPKNYWLVVPIESFKWQMKYLKDNYNVKVPSLLQENSFYNSPEPNKTIITFDDGLKSVYEYAIPVLKENSLPAICFVLPELSEKQIRIATEEIFDIIIQTKVTGIDLTPFGLSKLILPSPIDMREKFAGKLNSKLKTLEIDRVAKIHRFFIDTVAPDDFVSNFDLMTVDEIKMLSSTDEFTIASHSSHHHVLTKLTRQEFIDDMTLSHKMLEQWGIKFSPIFAYPNGLYNDETINVLKELGYQVSLTIKDNICSRDEDKLELSRIGIGANCSKHEFKARLSGLYEFLLEVSRN